MDRYKSHFAAMAKAAVLLLTSLCAITARAVTSQEIEQALVKIEHDRNEYETCAKQWITKMDERKQRVDLVNRAFVEALKNLNEPNRVSYLGDALNRYSMDQGYRVAEDDITIAQLNNWYKQLGHNVRNTLTMYELWTAENHRNAVPDAQIQHVTRDALIEMLATISEKTHRVVQQRFRRLTDFEDVRHIWRRSAVLITRDSTAITVPCYLAEYVLDHFEDGIQIVWDNKVFFCDRDPEFLEELDATTQEQITLKVGYSGRKGRPFIQAHKNGNTLLHTGALKKLEEECSGCDSGEPH